MFVDFLVKLLHWSIHKVNWFDFWNSFVIHFVVVVGGGGGGEKKQKQQARTIKGCWRQPIFWVGVLDKLGDSWGIFGNNITPHKSIIKVMEERVRISSKWSLWIFFFFFYCLKAGIKEGERAISAKTP